VVVCFGSVVKEFGWFDGFIYGRVLIGFGLMGVGVGMGGTFRRDSQELRVCSSRM